MQFSVIGISETWMNDNYSYEHFKIPNYEAYYSNRLHKKGGGTALYIHSKLKHQCSTEGTYTVENCFEVVTTEIKQAENKLFYVSCIYRPPNTCLDKFNKCYMDFLNKYKGKQMYICGDFNINLLKYETQLETTQFLDITYSYGLLPLITKPTRISNTTATLIDNIFTNTVY